MKIFVSYTTKDNYINRKTLSVISAKLSKYHDPFIDMLHNNSIKSQQQNKIKYEIEHCDLFLLIKTRSIYRSAWVKWEINQSKLLKKRNKMLVIYNIYSFNNTIKKLENINFFI